MWIDEVIEATKEAESPERFFQWAAIAAISAVVRKNVWINKRGIYNVYPNIYVILMAKSGLRKGFPVSVAKRLVEEVNVTRVISGRNSIQAVLKELAKPFKGIEDAVVKTSEGFMVSGEFSSFLLHDPAALTILTDLYDTYAHEKEWKNTLKTAGVDRLLSPVLTLLGASNEEHFRDAVPAKDVKGGFIGRASIIFEESKRRVDSLLSWNGEDSVPINFEKLSTYLKEISKIKGKFGLSKSSVELFNNWYNEFGAAQHQDSTGTLERMNDTILKIAMCVSLARDLSRQIELVDMELAMELCLGCVPGMKHVTMATGSAPYARQTQLILTYLVNNPEGMARKKLLQRGHGEYDSIDLDRIIQTLMDADAISVIRQGSKQSEEIYKMKQHALELYTKFKKEIN